MYSVAITPRKYGYRDMGCLPVKISNRIPLTMGEARLQALQITTEKPAWHCDASGAQSAVQNACQSSQSLQTRSFSRITSL